MKKEDTINWKNKPIRWSDLESIIIFLAWIILPFILIYIAFQDLAFNLVIIVALPVIAVLCFPGWIVHKLSRTK